MHARFFVLLGLYLIPNEKYDDMGKIHLNVVILGDT